MTRLQPKPDPDRQLARLPDGPLCAHLAQQAFDAALDLLAQVGALRPFGIVLAETHFRKVFTFGGLPMCALPPALRTNPDLLARYMGEYRDLATACSVRSEGDAVPPGRVPEAGSWVQQPKSRAVFFDAEEGRARFSWQDRKQLDLKGKPEACRTCDLVAMCEGVWRGYLEIWGDQDCRPIRLGDTALGG